MAEHHFERVWDPRRWDRSNRFLVGGELAAFAAAVLAMILDFPGDDAGKWWLYLTAAIAAGTLAGYAIARSVEGDKPLTGIETRRIARIAQAVALKDKFGIDVDWNTVSPDGRAAKASLQGIAIGAKRAMLKSWVERNLPAGLVRVDQMPDAEVEKLFATTHQEPVDLQFEDA